MIDTLPPRCREVVRLRRIEGLSQRETAERLGLSENVVEKEIRRGEQAVMTYRAALAQTLLVPVPAGREVQRDRRRD
jgi:RNA polymerase sigma-70 factor (ECF subfamily)